MNAELVPDEIRSAIEAVAGRPVARLWQVPGEPGLVLEVEDEESAPILWSRRRLKGRAGWEPRNGSDIIRGSKVRHRHVLDSQRRSMAWVVLRTFVGGPPADKPWALHLNDISDDDRLANLVWGDNATNRAHRSARLAELAPVARELGWTPTAVDRMIAEAVRAFAGAAA